MKIIEKLKKFYAVESVPTGASRALGVTVYRRDYQTHAFVEVQVDLLLWTAYVSLPVQSRVAAVGQGIDIS